MNYHEILTILKDVEAHRVNPDEAFRRFSIQHADELNHIVLDYHRPLRTGYPEAIFARGKSIEQLVAIVQKLFHDQKPILVTKMSTDQLCAVESLSLQNLEIHHDAGMALWNPSEVVERVGKIIVISGGASDQPIADEAFLTAHALGSQVEKVYDAGVAGIHRLLHHMELLQQAHVIIAVAGMEGALPSVVAGLVSVPVIAVPTSVGYGTSFHGISALLAMLNSCAPGISVVNIDNGFGAGYQANLINQRMTSKDQPFPNSHNPPHGEYKQG